MPIAEANSLFGCSSGSLRSVRTNPAVLREDRAEAMELRICLQCQELVPQGLTRCPHCAGGIGLADAWALIGRQLGRYRLTELIGAGGMGLVYSAEHTGLLRRVAIKLLLPSLDGAEFLERFRREARMLAELRHPNIVEIYDFDVTSAGVPFYAMELLDGMSLASALQRRQGPRSLASIAPGLRQIGAALDHAHRRQVIHRDLKPDNIYLARIDGEIRIKLLDFGIAKKLGGDSSNTGLTGTGAMLGTPLYLTPEQINGGPVDARADQYTLALIVAECLVGYPLRAGMSITEIIYRTQHQPIDIGQLPESLPASTRAALLRATDPDPAQRFASVLAFLDALDIGSAGSTDWAEALLADSTPTAAPAVLATTTPARLAATEPLSPSAGEASTAAGVRRRFWRWAVAACVLLAALALGWQLSRVPGADPSQPNVHASASALVEVARYPTPADAGSLLGVSDVGALLATAGGVYLRPLEPGSESTRRGNDADERIVGVSDAGKWLLRRGNRLMAADPMGAGEAEVLQLPAPLDGVHAYRSDGRALAYTRGSELMLIEAGTAPRQVASVPDGRLIDLRLGRQQLLAVLRAPLELQVHALDGNSPPWSFPSSVGRVHDLAWDEAAGRVAVCGFAPEAEVHQRGAAPQRIAVRNACHAVLWLPGSAQLVLRSDQELLLWSAGKTQTQTLALGVQAGAVGMAVPRLAYHQGRVLLSEPPAGLLLQFDLSAALVAPIETAGGSEIWDLLSIGPVQYVAHADGTLTRLAGDQPSAHRVHDAGITDLVGTAELLASASDDRSLAVWRSSDMSTTWRTRGHEFLVNQLWLAPDQSALWSSSSDGSLKRWRWPSLELVETIDLRQLLQAPELSLHAVWFSADQGEALVGTWNRALVHLTRDGTGWKAQRLPLASDSGYRLLEIAGLDAVALLGIRPTRLWLWDRRQNRLAELPDFGLELYALAPGSDPQRIMAGGNGALIEFELQRGADGMLAARRRVDLNTALGTIGAADVDAVGRRWWLGNNLGQVRPLRFDELPPFADGFRPLAYRDL